MTEFERLQQNLAFPTKHQNPPNSIPSFSPRHEYAMHPVDLHTIKNLTHCVSYIWDSSGKGNWIFPYEVTDEVIYCLKWSDCGWVESAIVLDNIDTYF